MAGFNISDFAAFGLPLGGARSSYFSVIIDTPSGVPNIGARMNFSCKATTIPESTLSVVEVPYFGRRIKLPGTRTFANWNVTILNDEDFQIRHAMETWSNLINFHQRNVRSADLGTNASFRTTGTVTQYSKTDLPIRTYEFMNLWPVIVSSIDLSWEQGDTIEEFTVEFAYDYWQVVAPTLTGVLQI